MLQGDTRARRTQEQRRSQTRRLLLEATVASLAELGHAATTTLEVERRAGVSRGARLHHFPSKAALLAGAIDLLYEQLSQRYASAFSASSQRRSERQRLHAGLREMWEIYQHAHYTAVFELNQLARTDAELRERLRSVATRHRELALQAAERFFPALTRRQAQRLIETIHAVFVGLRVQQGVTADGRHIEWVLTTLEEAIVHQLQQNQ